MYSRDVTEILVRFSGLYPVIGITGPRQSGKTTIAKFVFPNLPYVSLENIDIRLQASRDPRAFLAKYLEGAIFDEIQNAPELLSYLQEIVDFNPLKGRYVITGSQNFSISHHISQSLSGRIGMVTLLPLSMKELGRAADIHKSIFNGGYPRLHDISMNPVDFYPSYIQTYIERDVRQLKNIENYGRFQTFLKLCAGRVGQLVNFSSLAQDAGISHTTARQWLDILEASYIIFFLQPFYQNFNKRLVKMPKMYFYDTGLACSLLSLETATQLESHYLKGALFENLVVLEIMKKRTNLGLPTNIYFWRDRTGHEVDLIAQWGGNIHAIEIKFSSTLQNDQIKNLKYFMEFFKNTPQESIKGYLVYNGLQEGKYLDITLTPTHKIIENLT
jgi:hypothetical protein